MLNLSLACKINPVKRRLRSNKQKMRHNMCVYLHVEERTVPREKQRQRDGQLIEAKMQAMHTYMYCTVCGMYKSPPSL